MKAIVSILIVMPMLHSCGLVLDLDPANQPKDGAVLDVSVADGAHEMDAGPDSHASPDLGGDIGADRGGDAPDAPPDSGEMDAGSGLDGGECVLGAVQECGAFVCGRGERICQNEGWSDCTQRLELESCNMHDDDCDGSIDEGLTQLLWYEDLDDDGYGSAMAAVLACAQPDGYTAAAGDCADMDPTRHPGVDEICDRRDTDCDSRVDEGVQRAWYLDNDGDGFGAPDAIVLACVAPPFTTADSSDCDDTSLDRHPGADENCDLVDDDCDMVIDEGMVCGERCSSLNWGGHVYLICDGPETWEDAIHACRAVAPGYDLVTLSSVEEQAALSPAAGSSPVWIGLSDQLSEGRFRWVSGLPLAYTNWAGTSSEPNDRDENGGVGADCVAMVDEDGGLVWRDRACEEPYSYVCEGVPR